MALNLITKQVLNKVLRQTAKTYHINFAPVVQKRSESIDARSIVDRSPFEEVSANLDSNSSKENPMKINAYGDERTIACVCDDMHFMTLKKGPPVKCKCGYWFQLVDANKFWEKDTDSS